MDKQTLSQQQIHEEWSGQQLENFRLLPPEDRLLAVKTGALRHWTAQDREKALRLFSSANGPEKLKLPAIKVQDFGPAQKPLPPLATLSGRVDFLLAAALGGWLLILSAFSGHAFGLY
ncbi:MAG: hypothetical protein M0Z84_16245 [Gammaproteobacteria bacterium]|jgi:hypothetical protein|nr:hypothetical protein [Gammaproteobacteria bacterium]